MNKQINKNPPTEDITVNEVVVKTLRKPVEVSEEERLGLDKLQTPPTSGEETFSKDIKFTLDESLFEDVDGKKLKEDYREPRFWTNALLDYFDGVVDANGYDIILSLLKYMGEDDVADWARINGWDEILEDDEDIEESLKLNELKINSSVGKRTKDDVKKLLKNGYILKISKGNYTPTEFKFDNGKVYFFNKDICFGNEWYEHPEFDLDSVAEHAIKLQDEEGFKLSDKIVLSSNTFSGVDDEDDFEESFIVNESLTSASSDIRRKIMDTRLTEGQVRDLWFKVYDSLAPDTINKKIDKFPEVKLSDRYDASDLEIYDSNAIGVMAPTEDKLSFAKRVADYFGLKSVVSHGSKNDKYPWKLRIIIPGIK